MSGEVALATEGTTLRMSTVAGSDDRVHVDQTFQLVSSSTDLTILVNPKQFERLAGLVSGDVLRLEIGRFERQENQGTTSQDSTSQKGKQEDQKSRKQGSHMEQGETNHGDHGPKDEAKR